MEFATPTLLYTCTLPHADKIQRICCDNGECSFYRWGSLGLKNETNYATWPSDFNLAYYYALAKRYTAAQNAQALAPENNNHHDEH